MATVNGFHTAPDVSASPSPTRPLKPGVFAPIPTFFLPDSEDLDIPTFKAHILRVASAGVGLVLCGSMGEASHLTPSERTTLITTARQTLDNASPPLTHVPLIVGTGTGSTRETIALTHEAKNAGADYAIVIMSGYFAGVLGNGTKEAKQAIKEFFREVAGRSEIPVLMYNYPGASGGIDLDSDLITELAAECPNLCGIKLTCGNVGKLTRVASVVTTNEFITNFPRKHAPSEPFLVLGGYSDFLIPSVYANAHGAITGLANIAPHTISKLYTLGTTSLSSSSTLAEAQTLQGITARADFTISKASISGTKYLLEKLYGYGGLPRKPLPPINPVEGEKLWEHPDTKELVRVEREVSGKVQAKQEN